MSFAKLVSAASLLLVFFLSFALASPCFAQELSPAQIAADLQAIQKALQSSATPVPITSTDYTPLLQAILAAEQQLLTAQAQLLTVEKSTNTHVVNIDKTFGQTMAAVGTFVGKYIAPAVITFIAAKKL